MNQVGAYSNYQKNVESLPFLWFNIKDYDVAANPVMSETKAITEDKKAQDNAQNAGRIDMQSLSWGRVIQKGNETVNASSTGSNAFMCAFIEMPTAVELFEKARNMDRRNVEERTFATGGKVFDFTV